MIKHPLDDTHTHTHARTRTHTHETEDIAASCAALDVQHKRLFVDWPVASDHDRFLLY